MLGKTQDANESFNGTIWKRIPLPNLEFGVYDGVAHCNIRMKAPVLMYEKLNFVSMVYMLKRFRKCNLKRVNLVKPASELEKQTKTTNLAG